jgi:hypothetical protein
VLEVQDGGLEQISDVDRGLWHIRRSDASSFLRFFPECKKLPT